MIDVTAPLNTGYGIVLTGTGSRFALEGGTIQTNQEALDVNYFAKDASIAISGGKLISTNDNVMRINGTNTQINITGGETQGPTLFLSSSSGIDFSMTGGTLKSYTYTDYNVSIHIGGEAVIEGVNSTAILVKGTSTLEVTGGIITGDLGGDYDSKITVTGGSVDGKVYTSDDATATVIGGQFTENVDRFIPEGMTQDADGNVIIDTAVAMIQGYPYTSLEAALQAAQPGDSVEIIADVTLPSALRIGKGVTLKGIADAEGNLPSIQGSFVIESGNVTVDGLTFTAPTIVTAFDTEPVCIAINSGVYPNITIQNCAFETEEFQASVGKRYKGIVTSSAGTYKALTVQECTFKNLETAIHINPGTSNLVVKANEVTADSKAFGSFLKMHAVQTADITENSLNSDSLIYIRPDFSGGLGSNIHLNDNDLSKAWIQADQGTAVTDDLDLNENYWGGSLPDAAQLPAGVSVTSYYSDETMDNLVIISDEVGKEAKSVVIEAVNGTVNEFNVYLQGADDQGNDALIENLVAADLTIAATGSDGETFTVSAFEPVENWEIQPYPNGRYLLHEKGYQSGAAGNQAYDLSGNKILLGTLTVNGYGKGAIAVSDGTENIQQRSSDGQNRVISSDVSGVSYDFEIEKPTQQLTISITFPNAVQDNASQYQDMTVTISGGDLGTNIVKELGSDELALTAGGYTLTQELTQNLLYTVTVEGAGYRTARYTVTMTEDKTLTFWNNVKDEATVVETGNDASKVKTTFLAGDILQDNQINLYDLSAVVSYFGEDNLAAEHPEYAKYDLNRDGKIDSKDVAMVLVSWGN